MWAVKINSRIWRKGHRCCFCPRGCEGRDCRSQSKAADAMAREIDRGGKRAIGAAMDVIDKQQVETSTVRVIEAFSALDVLSNNARQMIVNDAKNPDVSSRQAGVVKNLTALLMFISAPVRRRGSRRTGSKLSPARTTSSTSGSTRRPGRSLTRAGRSTTSKR